MNIVIDNLCKSFDDKKVLTDFTATIEYQKTTALMGSSGSGKTTLANILLGFLDADSGNVTGLPQKKSAVFQEDRLSEDFSALANVMAACKQQALDVLNALGLQNDIKTRVSNLSGGMKRRVALSRALCAEYDFLLLDEPFKGLDEQTKNTVMKHVKSAIKDKTVLLITHNQDEAKFLADNIIYLN